MIVAVGKSVDEILSQTVVCEKKVVATDFGDKIVSGVIILLAVYFVYEVEYPQQLKLPLTFLQEKLLQIPSEGRLPMSYNNFFRATSCIEKNLEVDPEETQDPFDFAPSWCT